MTTALQVSVIVPHAMRFAAADLAAVARQVEDVGLDGVFVGDQLAATVPLAESTLVLATAAAATARIHVGFGVMVLALRHPAWAAKQVATLQQLSGGRVILGVGLGGAMHGTAAWDAVACPTASAPPARTPPTSPRCAPTKAAAIVADRPQRGLRPAEHRRPRADRPRENPPSLAGHPASDRLDLHRRGPCV